MTVSSIADPKAGPYVGNDSQTAFPFLFKCFSKNDLLVVEADDDGTETTLVVDSHFTVALNSNQNSNPGGTVTYPRGGVPLPTGYTLTIASDIDATQTTSIINGGGFNASVVENSFDRSVMLIKQLKSTLGRALQLSVTTPAGVDVTLPSPVANQIIGWDADGVSLANYASDTSTSTAELENRIASIASSSVGAGLNGFNWDLFYALNTAGWGVRTASNSYNVLRSIPVASWAAIANYTSTDEFTAEIRLALMNEPRVFVPAGLWNTDPDVMLPIADGGSLVGEGLMKTIFKATANGATEAELIAYDGGRVIGRDFTPGVANAYVTGCYLADFSVQLNHPAYNASNYRQIGIDLRNVTRSVVTRVHVGTLGIPGQAVCPIPSNVDACQGYGIVVGTRTSGGIDYCGGEENTIRDVLPWGAYKNITIDDDVICPLSGAHATVVDNVTIQGGHELLVQKLPYGAGCSFTRITVQANFRQSGNANPTIAMCIGGYNNEGSIKYGEMGTECDQLFTFLNGSENNSFLSNYAAYTGASTGLISDNGAAGSRNRLDYPEIVAGQPTGKRVVIYNKAALTGTYKGAWDSGGGVFVVDGSNGITLTRNGTGDYFLNVSPAQPNDDWVPKIVIDTNPSFHSGSVSIQSSTHSTTRVRFYCYAQNGGTTTVIDPVKVYASMAQAV